MAIKVSKEKAKTQAPASPSPARSMANRIPSPQSVDPVHVFGGYVESVSVIPRTHASLHLSPGRLATNNDEDGELKKVLLPFAELRLGGMSLSDVEHSSASKLPTHGEEENESFSTVFSANLPLENLAFILLDLATDLDGICQEVTELGHGELAVDPARMSFVRYYLAHLERQARRARLRLDRHYGEPTPEST